MMIQIIILCVIIVITTILGIHQIQQGYVGVYKRFGILSPKIVNPGLHSRIPFIQTVNMIQVSIQTDEIVNIPCGTSGGILVYFQKIEVVNRLRKNLVYQTIKNYTENYDKFWIYDKIHHQINEFCSKHSLQQIYINLFQKLDEQLMKALQKDIKLWAPGIEIISIRITKPKIPQAIKANFEQIQQTKIKCMITSQNQNVLIEKERTNMNKLIIQSRSQLQVKLIQLKKEIKQKQNEYKMAKIEAEIYLQKMRTQILLKFQNDIKQFEMQKSYLTEEFLNYQGIEAFTQNLSMVFGDKIPNIATNSLLLQSKTRPSQQLEQQNQEKQEKIKKNKQNKNSKRNGDKGSKRCNKSRKSSKNQNSYKKNSYKKNRQNNQL